MKTVHSDIESGLVVGIYYYYHDYSEHDQTTCIGRDTVLPAYFSGTILVNERLVIRSQLGNVRQNIRLRVQIELAET